MSPQQIWQAQSAGAPPVTLEYVRYRNATLAQKTTVRHWRSLVIAGLVSLQFVWNFFHRYADMPIRQAAGLYIYVILWINLVYWLKRTKPETMPDDAGVTGSLQFYRRELERQRDQSNGTFVRYFLLPLPGFLGLFASLIYERHPVHWGVVVALGIFMALMLEYVLWSRRQYRKRIQKEIDAVNLLLGRS